MAAPVLCTLQLIVPQNSATVCPRLAGCVSFLFSATPMAPSETISVETVELKSELRSIERLIEELLQRQSDLCSRLARLEPLVDQTPWTAAPSAVPPDVPGPSSPLPPTWTSIVQGTNRLSFPLYDPPDVDIPLSNFFSPLAELPDHSPPQPADRLTVSQSAARKRRAPVPSTSPSGSPSPTAPDGKRPRRSLADSEPSASAPRVSAPSQKSPVVVQASDQVRNHAAPPTVISSLPIGHHLRSKLAVYTDTLCTARPEILILGDSIVRFANLPGAVTYCLSGGKTADFIELIPVLLDFHPSIHTVISHSGTNDVMSRHSIKLHHDLESLATTVECLGRRFILSGPIPSLSKSSERFSRLFSLHQWMENFSTATGLAFISHFDSFWTRQDLFKHDGLHLNKRGTGVLIQNFINFIAFNLN